MMDLAWGPYKWQWKKPSPMHMLFFLLHSQEGIHIGDEQACHCLIHRCHLDTIRIVSERQEANLQIHVAPHETPPSGTFIWLLAHKRVGRQVAHANQHPKSQTLSNCHGEFIEKQIHYFWECAARFMGNNKRCNNYGACSQTIAKLEDSFITHWCDHHIFCKWEDDLKWHSSHTCILFLFELQRARPSFPSGLYLN